MAVNCNFRIRAATAEWVCELWAMPAVGTPSVSVSVLLTHAHSFHRPVSVYEYSKNDLIKITTSAYRIIMMNTLHIRNTSHAPGLTKCVIPSICNAFFAPLSWVFLFGEILNIRHSFKICKICSIKNCATHIPFPVPKSLPAQCI